MDVDLALRLLDIHLERRKMHAALRGRYPYSDPKLRDTNRARLTVNGPAMWCLDVDDVHCNIEEHDNYYAIKTNSWNDQESQIAKGTF